MTTKPRLTHLEVKRLRQSTGLSQDRFAEALGVSRRTVEDWECAHRNAAPWYLTLAVAALSPALQAAPTPAPAVIARYGEVKIASVSRAALDALGVSGFTTSNVVQFVVDPVHGGAAANLANILNYRLAGRTDYTVGEVASAMSAHPVKEPSS